MRGARSKWEKFCTFFSGLPRNQWLESGRGQAWSRGCLFATSQPQPRAPDDQTLWSLSRQGQRGGGAGKRVRDLDVKEQGIYFRAGWKSHDRFHNLKTYFTFYCAHLFLAIIKMSLSSGRLGGVTLYPSQGITYGNNPRHVATSNPLCLGNALEYLGWKVQFLLEREPPKWVCLQKSPRECWASQTSVKQVLWLTERCGGNRCP